MRRGTGINEAVGDRLAVDPLPWNRFYQTVPAAGAKRSDQPVTPGRRQPEAARDGGRSGGGGETSRGEPVLPAGVRGAGTGPDRGRRRRDGLAGRELQNKR